MSFSTSNRTSFNTNVLDSSIMSLNSSSITNITSILNKRNLQGYTINIEGENYELSDNSWTPITFSIGMGSIIDTSFGIPISYNRANIKNINISIEGDLSENFLVYGDIKSEGISIDINSGDTYKTINNDIEENYVMINSNNYLTKSIFIETAGQHILSHVKVRMSIFVSNYDTLVDEYNKYSDENIIL